MSISKDKTLAAFQRFGGAMYTPVILFAFFGLAVALSIIAKQTILLGAIAEKGTIWYDFWFVVEQGAWTVFSQMPILFAIYYGVRDMVYEGPANFLWMSNIATDVKNTEFPFIMPILSALTTYVASKQTMADNNSMQNQMMLYFMPLMIGYMSWQFSGGLVIYWVVMNIMQIAQQTYMAHLENKARAAAVAPKAAVSAPEKKEPEKKQKNQKK